MVQEAPEDRYTARAPAESIFTEADSVAELTRMCATPFAAHFEESQQPKVIRLHFVREEVIGI
jgi:hypothetical protein